MVWSVKLTTGALSQASAAVGAVKLGLAGHSMVVSAPCPLKVGAVESATVMVWLTGRLTFPLQSRAVQVRLIW